MSAIKYFIMCFVVVSVMSSFAFASDDAQNATAFPGPVESSLLKSTLETMNNYSTDIEIKKQQIAIEELNLKLDQLQLERKQLKGPAPQKAQKVIPARPVGMAPPRLVPSGDLPVVSSLYGIEGNLSAELLYNDGNVFRAKLHDRLPEGFVVSHISDGGVVIEKAKQKYVLKFAPPAEDTETESDS